MKWKEPVTFDRCFEKAGLYTHKQKANLTRSCACPCKWITGGDGRCRDCRWRNGVWSRLRLDGCPRWIQREFGWWTESVWKIIDLWYSKQL